MTNGISEQDYIGSWLGASECLGAPVEFRVLRNLVSNVDWRYTLNICALTAASLANSPDSIRTPSIQEKLRSSLAGLRFQSSELLFRIGQAAAYHPGKPIAHERGLLFLQALAIMYGGSSRARPSNELHYLALSLLLANDHIPQPIATIQGPLAEMENFIGAVILHSQFNTTGDELSLFLRQAEMLNLLPSQGPLAEKEVWQKIQHDAFFGFSAREYVEQLAGPLFIMSCGWSDEIPDRAPSVDLTEFFAQTKVPPLHALQFLKRLSKPRDWYRRQLVAKTLNGIPQSLGCFRVAPLISTGKSSLTAASPWVVREHLRLGLWHQIMAAAKAHFGDNKAPKIWPSAFGYLFERWCSRLAANLQTVLPEHQKVILPTQPGAADEIEDVILSSPNVAILFSVKCNIVRANVSIDSADTAEGMKWLQDFLFKGNSKKRLGRAGVIHQLRKKIEQIRSGKFEPRISSDATIIPCIVTYENIGETGVTYRWLEEKLKHDSIYATVNTTLPCFATIGVFERIVAAGMAGEDIFEFFVSRHLDPNRRLLRLEVDVGTYWPEIRIPEFMREDMTQLIERIQTRLFDRSPEARPS